MYNGSSVKGFNCYGFQAYVAEQKINRKVTRIKTFEVYVAMHVALCMFIMLVLASQLLSGQSHRNAGLAIPPLFWPVHGIKIWGHVALLSGPTVHSLCCAYVAKCK